uniref:Melanotransferrin n=1 Tax=Sarcophilus harrisii TaxID=9305 RepID=A0A7N4PCF4_SARHA
MRTLCQLASLLLSLRAGKGPPLGAPAWPRDRGGGRVSAWALPRPRGCLSPPTPERPSRDLFGWGGSPGQAQGTWHRSAEEGGSRGAWPPEGRRRRGTLRGSGGSRGAWPPEGRRRRGTLRGSGGSRGADTADGTLGAVLERTALSCPWHFQRLGSRSPAASPPLTSHVPEPFQAPGIQTDRGGGGGGGAHWGAPFPPPSGPGAGRGGGACPQGSRPVRAPPALALSELRWCAISDPEREKCEAMAAAFREAAIQPALRCVLGTSAEHCVRLIQVSAPAPAGNYSLRPLSESARAPGRGTVGRAPSGPGAVRDGGRAEVTEWRRCHLARVPAHAVVVRADTDGAQVFRMLREGQMRFNHAGASFQMFESEAFGQKNLLFKDSTTELVPIGTQTYQAWLGADYLHAMMGLVCDPDRLPRYLRWCVLSAAEIQKCGDMAVAFSRKQLKPDIQCVAGESTRHCMEQIQVGNRGRLRPRPSASGPASLRLWPRPSDSYYAVAVVKRNSSYSFTLDELRGKRSCHAGHGTPAGWDIPVGVLVHRGFIRPKGCDILEAVSEFFSASCVPVNNAQDYPPRLCQLCIGDEHGLNKCYGNSQERYYGYSGAFRCLAEGAGDVAFVTHSTVFENTNGHNPEDWAVHLKSEDYELLCPNGARAEVTQFAACNLAQVPAHAVMVHPDTNPFAVYGLLDKAQELFGNDSNKNGFKMFDSSDYHGQDLLFKDSTVRLVPVREKTGPESSRGLRSLLSPASLSSLAVPAAPALLLLLLLTLGSILSSPAL